MMFLCFDIGGTITKLALLDENFTFYHQEEYPTNTQYGGSYIINKIISKIKDFSNLSGVAIATGGVVDTKNKTIIYANNNIPNYTGIDFKIITEVTGLNVSVENDVNCFALSERDDNFIMLTIGTGIGGAIVINKEIYHGAYFSAGEFGQMIINDDTFENKASITALIKAANNVNLNVNNGCDVFKLYDQDVRIAKMVVMKFYNHLALGIINLGYIFNCKNIYLGGGVTQRKTFLEELNTFISQYQNPAYFKSQIKIASFPNEGGLIGALVHHFNTK